MPVETFCTSFDSVQNKQQYGTKITFTDGRGGGGLKTVLTFRGFVT